MMLNKNAERRTYLSSFKSWGRNSLSTLNVVLVVGFLHVLSLKLRNSSSIAGSFYHEWVFNFVTCFTAPVDMTTCFFLFSLLIRLIP